MSAESTTLGGLNCRVVDDLPEGRDPRLVVVLCHGFGAPGDDLVPLGRELLTSDRTLAGTARFVFPAAPLSLAEMGMPGGRAWWHLDVERLTAAVERGELRDMRNDLPEGLPEARGMLSQLVEDMRQQWGVSTSQVVLGGFSQGSMVATDVALRLDESPAGLAIFSGTLLCEAEWRELSAGKRSFPILQSHGRQDPLLPFQAAEWLRDMLVESGFEVEFVPFDGMHTIPLEALQRFAALLNRLAAE